MPGLAEIVIAVGKPERDSDGPDVPREQMDAIGDVIAAMEAKDAPAFADALASFVRIVMAGDDSEEA